MTRGFLLVGHDATTDPGFTLNDLAGAAGRIDVLVRAVTNALCRSHGVRDDTEVWLCLRGDGAADGPRTIRIEGRSVQRLNPDERSTAALVKKALAVDVVPNGHFETSTPGITIAEMGWDEAIVRFGSEFDVIGTDVSGTDVRATPDDWWTDRRPGFVLSDHRPLADAERADVDRESGGRCVSVGTGWLQGHQVITLLHDELDRRRPSS